MNLKKISAAMIAMSAWVSVAHANPNACPAVTSITQVAGEYGGYVYSAPAQNGQHWAGENPMADQDDLKHVAFVEAYIHNNKSFVACDYSGPHTSGMRMALKLNAPASPIGNAWTNETQKDGTVLPRCTATNPTECKFN